MLTEIRMVGPVMAALTLALPAGAQTLHHVDVFQDAVVATWRAEARSGSCAVAHSFHAHSTVDLFVFDGDAAAQRGGLVAEPVDWYPEGGQEQHAALVTAAEAARLEWALKVAQLELTEEDLALLRANRKVGGTAESLLVEDLQEMADWMHEAIRELLFRRVELQAEVAAAAVALAESEAARDAAAPRTVQRWSVNFPDAVGSAGGAVWTQVVERAGGQRWRPADVLLLAPGTAPRLEWSQRAEVTVDLPWSGAPVPMRFHDAVYRGLDGSPDARPELLAMDYAVRAKSAAYEGIRQEPFIPGVSWPVEGLSPGADWHRNVSLDRQSLPVQVLYFTVPKQSPTVNMRLSLSRPPAPVAAMDQALLRVGDRPAGRVWITERGDSLDVDAGVVRDWTVEREQQAALCSKAVIGGRIKHHRAYRIIVTNRSAVAGEVLIEEPLPVSRNAEIEVSPDALGGGVLDAPTGIVSWRMTLAAGESRAIQFSYDLSHSKDTPAPRFD